MVADELPGLSAPMSRGTPRAAGAESSCVTFCWGWGWRRRDRQSAILSAWPRRPWRVCWYRRPASRTWRRFAAAEHAGEQYRHRRSHRRHSRKSPPHRAHSRATSSPRSTPPRAPRWISRRERANQVTGWLDPFSVDPLDGLECHLRAVVFLAPVVCRPNPAGRGSATWAADRHQGEPRAGGPLTGGGPAGSAPSGTVARAP